MAADEKSDGRPAYRTITLSDDAYRPWERLKAEREKTLGVALSWTDFMKLLMKDMMEQRRRSQ